MGTSFKPRAFKAEQDGEAFLCACKQTRNAPYCDGSHKQFSSDQVGKEGPGIKTEASVLPVAVPAPEEPTMAFIHQLAKEGLSKLGHHGPMVSMGVPLNQLPHWDDIRIMAAQMATKPLMEDQSVGTELIVGPEAKKPLRLSIPLMVSDMSFGALSEEAKVSLARGAELAGTGICSGEGGKRGAKKALRSNQTTFDQGVECFARGGRVIPLGPEHATARILNDEAGIWHVAICLLSGTIFQSSGNSGGLISRSS